MIIYLQYTFDEVKKEFDIRGYELITTESEYQNASQRLEYICPVHREKGILRISFSKLKHGQGCTYCGRIRTGLTHRAKLRCEEDAECCKNHDFTYVDTIRENGIIYIQFICNKHRDMGIQKMRRGNMHRDIKGCKCCRGEMPEWYVKKQINEMHPNLEIVGDYKNKTSSLLCKCKIHDYTFSTIPQRLLIGRGCYYCGIEKVVKHNTLSQEEFVKKAHEANPDVEVVSEYTGYHNEITLRCKKCSYEWVTSAGSFLANGTRCRKCSYTYKGEDQVIDALNDLGLSFIHQYKFDDCKDKKSLPFDFYIQQYNLCIEFDGLQHYEPRFGEDNLRKTKEHDKIKDEYCKNNDIHLLRIPYWESNNISEIIKNKIKEIA